MIGRMTRRRRRRSEVRELGTELVDSRAYGYEIELPSWIHHEGTSISCIIPLLVQHSK